MEDQTRENLNQLLRQFLDPERAEAAAEDIRTGERLLDLYPAPTPGAELIARIKADMATSRMRRRRITLLLRRSLAAAAVIAFALLALLGRGPSGPAGPSAFQASILPAAIWESQDVAADDPDLAYFTGEVRRIEVQLQALQAGEDEAAGTGAADELETELKQIESELRKG